MTHFVPSNDPNSLTISTADGPVKFSVKTNAQSDPGMMSQFIGAIRENIEAKGWGPPRTAQPA